MRSRGFSLLEAVLALFLLSLITILLANLLPSSRLTIKKGENRYQAQLLAESVLDRTRAERFDQLALGNTTLDPEERGGTTYQLTREVGTVDGHPADRLLSIKVRVTWREKTGDLELVRETYLANVPR